MGGGILAVGGGLTVELRIPWWILEGWVVQALGREKRVCCDLEMDMLTGRMKIVAPELSAR